MQYLVLGSILLFLVLYMTKDMRQAHLASFLPTPLTSWLSEPNGYTSRPRHVTYTPRRDVEETMDTIKEKTALDEWIQSRLTQKGLKDMTESGYWQADQTAAAL